MHRGNLAFLDNEPDWLTHSHGVDPETDMAVGAKAAILGTFVNNAIERT